MGIEHVRSEIEHMRIQVGRQRREILQLQRAGLSTAAAELLLGRMRAKIDDLSAERERLKGEQGGPTKGRAWRQGLVMAEPLKWYDDKADDSPWIKALAELRQRATREGYCYQHVQAITVAIDQHAEKALGNRTTFSTSHMASAERCLARKSVELGEGRNRSHERGRQLRRPYFMIHHHPAPATAVMAMDITKDSEISFVHSQYDTHAISNRQHAAPLVFREISASASAVCAKTS
jgi:hypothetical protein